MYREPHSKNKGNILSLPRLSSSPTADFLSISFFFFLLESATRPKSGWTLIFFIDFFVLFYILPYIGFWGLSFFNCHFHTKKISKGFLLFSVFTPKLYEHLMGFVFIFFYILHFFLFCLFKFDVTSALPLLQCSVKGCPSTLPFIFLILFLLLLSWIAGVDLLYHFESLTFDCWIIQTSFLLLFSCGFHLFLYFYLVPKQKFIPGPFSIESKFIFSFTFGEFFLALGFVVVETFGGIVNVISYCRIFDISIYST